MTTLRTEKYLVLKYADDILVDMIVADDGSSDDTVELVKFWLQKNTTIFSITNCRLNYDDP